MTKFRIFALIFACLISLMLLNSCSDDSSTEPDDDLNFAPNASFTISSEGNTFSFDASASLDVEDDNASLKVRWDFESDGKFDTGWALEKTISHEYSAGTYKVTLEVKDSGGEIGTKTKKITVK